MRRKTHFYLDKTLVQGQTRSNTLSKLKIKHIPVRREGQILVWTPVNELSKYLQWRVLLQII